MTILFSRKSYIIVDKKILLSLRVLGNTLNFKVIALVLITYEGPTVVPSVYKLCRVIV